MVADGLGAHPDGDLAAGFALQAAAETFERLATPTIADPHRFLETALQLAHHSIVRYATEQQMSDAPLTTLVAALIQDETLHWIHCGDSRLYVVRDGRLLLRTRDHSHVEYAASHGLYTKGLNKGLLYACLGMTKTPTVNVGGPLALKPGDRLLLCSDGLWGNLADDEIVAGLALGTVKQAATDLVEHAMGRCGGHCDNVTVVAIDWGCGFGSAADIIDTKVMSQPAGDSSPTFDLPNVLA